MSSFKNKVVWITGASSGIGEALAYALAKRRANLILSSRRKQELERVKENCECNASKVQILPLDLAETENLPQKAEQALNYWGRVDYLFNNGGMSQLSYAAETEMNVIRKVMEVNFFGTVALTKAVLPGMMEQQSGHIVVISSVMGKLGSRFRSTYAASKHALHGWFDSLRQEVFDENIKVTLVCPGFIKTEITVNAIEGDGSKHGKMNSGQQQGMLPDEFAKKMLTKILKGKEEIYIGGKEIAGVYLKRFAPRLLSKILRHSRVT